MPLYRTVSDRGLWKKYNGSSFPTPQHFHKPHYISQSKEPQVTYSQLNLGNGYRRDSHVSIPSASDSPRRHSVIEEPHKNHVKYSKFKSAPTSRSATPGPHNRLKSVHLNVAPSGNNSQYSESRPCTATSNYTDVTDEDRFSFESRSLAAFSNFSGRDSVLGPKEDKENPFVTGSVLANEAESVVKLFMRNMNAEPKYINVVDSASFANADPPKSTSSPKTDTRELIMSINKEFRNTGIIDSEAKRRDPPPVNKYLRKDVVKSFTTPMMHHAEVVHLRQDDSSSSSSSDEEESEEASSSSSSSSSPSIENGHSFSHNTAHTTSDPSSSFEGGIHPALMVNGDSDDSRNKPGFFSSIFRSKKSEADERSKASSERTSNLDDLIKNQEDALKEAKRKNDLITAELATYHRDRELRSSNNKEWYSSPSPTPQEKQRPTEKTEYDRRALENNLKSKKKELEELSALEKEFQDEKRRYDQSSRLAKYLRANEEVEEEKSDRPSQNTTQEIDVDAILGFQCDEEEYEKQEDNKDNIEECEDDDTPNTTIIKEDIELHPDNIRETVASSSAKPSFFTFNKIKKPKRTPEHKEERKSAPKSFFNFSKFQSKKSDNFNSRSSMQPVNVDHLVDDGYEDDNNIENLPAQESDQSPREYPATDTESSSETNGTLKRKKVIAKSVSDFFAPRRQPSRRPERSSSHRNIASKEPEPAVEDRRKSIPRSQSRGGLAGLFGSGPRIKADPEKRKSLPQLSHDEDESSKRNKRFSGFFGTAPRTKRNSEKRKSLPQLPPQPSTEFQNVTPARIEREDEDEEDNTVNFAKTGSYKRNYFPIDEPPPPQAHRIEDPTEKIETLPTLEPRIDYINESNSSATIPSDYKSYKDEPQADITPGYATPRRQYGRRSGRFRKNPPQEIVHIPNRRAPSPGVKRTESYKQAKNTPVNEERERSFSRQRYSHSSMPRVNSTQQRQRGRHKQHQGTDPCKVQ